jgi:hypothetical protein
LVAVRDFLIAAALAWLGVSVERAEGGGASAERPCVTDVCQPAAD